MDFLNHIFSKAFNKNFILEAKTSFFLVVMFFLGLFSAAAQCPSIANTSQSFCDIQPPIIADLNAIDNGGGFSWYDTATSTQILPLGTGLANGEDYYLDNATGNCGSRIRVVVSLYKAPIGPNFQGICVSALNEATLASLYAIGNNIQWYTTPFDGTPLPLETIVTSGSTYYAGQTNPITGCLTSRLPVSVTVNVVLGPTGDAVQSFCNTTGNPPKVGDLVASGINNWYSTTTSALVLSLNTPLIDGHTYYGTNVSPPCESTQKLQVLVNLIPENNAGSNNSVSICETTLTSGIPLNLFNNLAGNPSNSGFWTGPKATTNGNLGTLDVSSLSVSGSPYVFTYTVNTSTICPPASATVTVIVESPVNAGTDAIIKFCRNNAPVNLFSILGGNPNGGGTWLPALASGTGVFNPAIDPAGIYTYTVAGGIACPSDSATVTVTIDDLVDAGTSGTSTICESTIASGGFINLFNNLGGTPSNLGIWTGPFATINGNLGTLDLSTLSVSGSPYVFSYTVNTSAVCPSATSTVTIIIEASVYAGTDETISFCENDASTNLFSSLGGNPNVGGTWSPAMASGTGIFNPAVDPAGIYTYTVTGGVACPNDSATVTVSVDYLLDAGTDATLTLCETNLTAGATLNLFTNLGGTPSNLGIWSGPFATTNGNLGTLDISNLSISGNPYLFTYTLNTSAICGPTEATVEITIESPLSAGTNSSIAFCKNENPSDLFSILGGNPEAGGNWSPLLLSGTGIFDPGVDVAGVYTYTLPATANCPSSSATVTVTIEELLDAGQNGNIVICEANLNTGSLINLYNNLGGTPSNLGIWTGPFATINGNLGTLNISNLSISGSPYVYTYTVNSSSTCPAATATVTIVIEPAVNAGTNATITICENNGPTDLFLSLGGNPNAGGTWSPALTSGTGVFIPGVDTAGIYTYTLPSTTICPSDFATVTVNVVPNLNAGTNATVNLCQNDSAINLFSLLGPNAAVGGTWSPALASGTDFFNPGIDVAGDYTYILAGTTNCPGDSATVTVIVVPTLNAGTNAVVTFCQSQTSINLFSLLGGTPNVGGTWSPALASGSGFFNPAIDVAGIYTYTLAGTGSCSGDSATVTVNVVPTLNAGTDTSVTFCQAQPSIDLFTLLGGTPNVGGTWSPTLASGTGFFNPTLDVAGIYTYTLAGTTSCSGDSATVTVNVVPTLNAGTNASVTFCQNQSPINLFTLLGGTPNLGGTWSPTLTSGSGFFNPAIDAAGIYTYTLGGTSSCLGDSATVNVNLLPALNAGIDATVTFCQAQIPINLFNLLGGSPNVGGTWSPALASGTGVFNPAVDVAGIYTYTVVGASTCPSDSATVTVFVVQNLDAGTNGVVTFCQNNSPTNLFNLLGGTPNVGGTWSPALASGSGIFNPAVDAAGIYTYTLAGTSSCLGDSAIVTVNIVPTLNAGTNAVVTFCQAQLPTNLFNLLGGTPNVGGTWSPALASGTGIFNPAVDVAGIYTYTLLGSGACATSSATVTVFVVQNLDAGTNSVVTFCQNNSPTNLFSSLGGTPNVGGTWSPALASGSGIFNPALDAAGIYTYTLAGTSSCPGDSAIVTVNIVPTLNAGTNAVVTFCQAQLPTNLFNLLGGTPNVGGTWSPALASGTGIFNPAVDVAGIYTYTLLGSGACPSSSATVTVFVVQNLDAGTNGVVTFCQNNSPTNLFLSLGGSPNVGGTWSPTLAGGSGIFNPAVDAAGIYTYTLAGTSSCPGDSATVTVNVVPTLNAGTNAVVTFCQAQLPTNLFSLLGGTPNVGGTWSPALASGTGIFNPTVDVAGIYTYTLAGSGACASPSATVTVNIVSSLNAGTNATVTYCQAQTPINLFTFLGVNANVGGTWSPALASGSGIFNPAVDVAGIYTYTLAGTSSCTGDSATVTVNIVSTLNAGTNASVTFCQNQASVNLFSLLGGNPNVGGTWSPALASGSGIFNPAVDVTGIYTYTLAGSASCPSSSATVTVTVDKLPTITLANIDIGAICLNANGTISITNAINLSNGNYQLTYQISGTIAFTSTISVNFQNGSTSFIIPSTVLNSIGTSSLSINPIQSNLGNSCGISSHFFNTVSFTLEDISTPTFNGSNEFCDTDNATIADLTSGIVTTQTVVWYDAPTNGNAYANTTPLINGTTYYAALVSTSGCESNIRFEVSVTIKDCQNPAFIIPDGFSPNGDGTNDTFEIKNIRTLYPNFTIVIYNRWGNVLFEGNAAKPDWDGNNNEGIKLGGSKLPIGVYFYILNFNDDTKKDVQGRLYLSR